MTVRRAVIIGAPLLAYLTALYHPDHLLLGRDPWRFIVVHLLWTPILVLLAQMIVLLVDGVDGVAASLARGLALPFAVAYTVFTTFGGIAMGAFVWKANALPAAQRDRAGVLIHDVSHSALAHPLYLVATGLWLAAILAMVIALRARAPWPALALIAAGAAAFGYNHVQPWGPGGMAAFLAGVVWLEFRPVVAARSSSANALRSGR
ncbi:MAG: hypothetical protein WCH31_09900 [Actinomycetes bacterium]